MATGTILIPVQSIKIGGSFITAGARIEGGAGLWKALLAAGSTEQFLSQFEIPENFASALVAKKKYAMASANSGKVDLETEVMAIADGEDIDTASFDSVNEKSGGTTVPGTAGFRDTIEQALVNDDSITAEETCILRESRDHDDADDTATGDLELIGYVAEYATT